MEGRFTERNPPSSWVAIGAGGLTAGPSWWGRPCQYEQKIPFINQKQKDYSAYFAEAGWA